MLEKIIYLNPWETYLGELTWSAESQIKNIIKNVIEKNTADLTIACRTSKETENQGADTILYIDKKSKGKFINNPMDIYNHIIEHPEQIEEVSTWITKGQSAIITVSHKELIQIIAKLDGTEYNGVPSKNKINRHHTLYALTICIDKKICELFCAFYGI